MRSPALKSAESRGPEGTRLRGRPTRPSACFEIQRELAASEHIWGAIEYATSCGVGICGKCAAPSGSLSCIDGPFMGYAEFVATRRGL